MLDILCLWCVFELMFEDFINKYFVVRSIVKNAYLTANNFLTHEIYIHFNMCGALMNKIIGKINRTYVVTI